MFLYHACLMNHADANQIHAKVSRGLKGIRGEWKFPDLSLGSDELLVEIKFIGKEFDSDHRGSVRRSAKESMAALSTHPLFKQKERVLAIFDEARSLYQEERNEIVDVDHAISVIFYPTTARSLYNK
ncbi:MAG: hypothetical protein ACRDF4_06215 [Rhabdochlamydiaceae bacterium]